MVISSNDHHTIFPCVPKVLLMSVFLNSAANVTAHRQHTFLFTVQPYLIFTVIWVFRAFVTCMNLLLLQFVSFSQTQCLCKSTSLVKCPEWYTNFVHSKQTKNANFCKLLEGIFKGKQKYRTEMAASCCVRLCRIENLVS